MTVDGYELIPTKYEGAIEWSRSWVNAIAPATRGSEEREQRIAKGLKSISFLAVPLTLEERAGMDASIIAALKSGKVCTPFWGRSSCLALAAAAGDTTATIEPNAWDWIAADWVFFLNQSTHAFEVRSITEISTVVLAGGITATELTLNAALTGAYPAGALIWPLIYGELKVDGAAVNDTHRSFPKLTISEWDVAKTNVEGSCPVLSTYLGRPIAPVGLSGLSGISWMDGVRKTYAFDLRKFKLGFGSPTFAPLQNWVVNGHDFSILLDGDAAIKAWDCFTASLPGSAAGFWLPEPSCVFELITTGTTNTLQVVSTGLAATWAADPDVYLAFRKDGTADQFAKITAVADLGGGVEQVSLDANVTVDAATMVFRLRYMRLAEDIEKARLDVENRQLRSVSVVELPNEYALAETTAAPVWIYTFWMEAPAGNVYWRYTSYPQNFSSNGNLFATFNINHDAIKRSAGATTSDEVTVHGARENGSVFALFSPLTANLNIWAKIEEATVGAPDVTEVLFTGLALKGQFSGGSQGKLASVKVVSAIDALGANAPNFLVQRRFCNYRVFSAAPACGLNRATYKVDVKIKVISADRLTIDLLTAADGAIDGANAAGFAINTTNYFALGWLEVGAGAGFQFATIMASAVQAVTLPGPLVVPHGLRIVLSNALASGAAVGDTGTVYPGCDGYHTTCIQKYANGINGGMHPRMPVKNPSIARPGTVTNAGKK